MQEAITKLTHSKDKMQHWTAGSPLRMVRAISADFIAQLESIIEEIPGFSHGDLAKRIGVSLGRVSQVMNSPGNFTLKNTVVYTNAVEMNLAIVVYPIEPNGNGAPISGDVFRTCWEIAGRPRNMFDIHDNTVGFTTHSGCGMAAIGHVWKTSAKTDSNNQLISFVPINGYASINAPTITGEGKIRNNA